MSEIQTYFKNNNYVVIRGLLDIEMSHLLYYYCCSKAVASDFKYLHDRQKYDHDWDGNFEDPQAYGSYSKYGDPLMDGLLVLVQNKIEEYTGLNLQPNYSYWRLYQYGDELKRHRDRDSCEISATLCLGYNVSNIDTKIYPTYNWPIFVESNDRPEGMPVSLNPGDLIIYRGCEIDHWREKFLGLNHAQVFLHYNDTSGDIDNLYDGRPIIGIPKRFKR